MSDDIQHLWSTALSLEKLFSALWVLTNILLIIMSLFFLFLPLFCFSAALFSPTSPCSSSSMLSPLYKDHGSSAVLPQTLSCPSSSQGHRPLRRHPPPISGSSLGPNPTYYHAVYDVQVDQYKEVPFIAGGGSYGVRTGRSSMSLVTNDPTVPLVRRRGGLVDHRDVILAHQAHKLHNTPQARRKQWEWVQFTFYIGDLQLDTALLKLHFSFCNHKVDTLSAFVTIVEFYGFVFLLFCHSKMLELNEAREKIKQRLECALQLLMHWYEYFGRYK